MSLLEQAAKYYRNYGALRSVRKILTYPLLRLRRKQFRKSLEGQDPAVVFNRIHDSNIWGESESRSGAGSTLLSTKNVRANLPIIFEKYQVRAFLDAPCGDYNWMQAVELPPGTTYTGGDIVPEIVRRNREHHADAQHGFIELNIIADDLPKADLMLCRDCLFHFSYRDTFRFFENFVRSGIPLLLTTTHTNTTAFRNKDIATGDFRQIDLFSAPYFLPQDVLYRFDDRVPQSRPRDLCLWTSAQIASALEKARAAGATA